MFSASVTIRPRKPSESRRIPVRMLGATVPGRSWPASMPGRAMWADITTSTPAAIAARKGTSSTESSRAQLEPITGSDRWESVPVSGKMFRRRQHAVVLQPAHLGGDQPAHVAGVLAEGAGVDDRVGRIVVHVRDRREGQVHAD